MLIRAELPPQEQLNVVMRTVQFRVEPARTLEGAIASDLVRANLSIYNFLRQGQQEDLISMPIIVF